MSDYMVQKADDQIQAGLNEQQFLYSEIDRLNLQISALKAEAEKLVESLQFYSDHADCHGRTNWGTCKCSFCRSEDKYRNTITAYREKYPKGEV